MITKEDVILWFTRINNKCDRVTTENYSHNVALIKALAFNQKQYGEIMAYNNLTHIAEIASEVTAGNVTHKVATVKSLCKRNIDFINEFGLEK